MPKPISEITVGQPPPPSEQEAILRFFHRQRGLAYTAREITQERAPLIHVVDAPLDDTLRWVHMVRKEPADARLERIRGLLDDLAAAGKLQRATADDGQHYYWY